MTNRAVLNKRHSSVSKNRCPGLLFNPFRIFKFDLEFRSCLLVFYHLLPLLTRQQQQDWASRPTEDCQMEKLTGRGGTRTRDFQVEIPRCWLFDRYRLCRSSDKTGSLLDPAKVVQIQLGSLSFESLLYGIF